MSENEKPMNPELAAALKAYEAEVLDGTERSQRSAFERLQAVRRNLGGAAIVRSDDGETKAVAS